MWEGECAAGEAAKLQLHQVQNRLEAEQEHTVELEGELEALLNHVQQVALSLFMPLYTLKITLSLTYYHLYLLL